MQEANKCKTIKNDILQKLKNKKILIILIAIIIFASCIITIVTPQIIKNIKPSTNALLEYEIIKKIGNGKYEILITIKDESEIEYVKFPDGDILYGKERTIIAIDYKISEGIEYNFIIKINGKDEVTETIYLEIPRIEGEYILVNGVYVNRPDLSGFNSIYTRYLLEAQNQDNLTPGKWIISEINDEEWYDYKNSKWANAYVENNGSDVYYVWIPRYCFKLDQQAQRSDVKFIDTLNNYKDENGNLTTWDELEEQGYQIPEAFEFDNVRIPGYWAIKYTVGDTITPSIINYDMSVYRGIITIRNIILNTTITNANPIVKYTIALNGEIVTTIESSNEIANIGSQVKELSNMIEGENVINVTGLNAKGEIVGSMTKLYTPAKVNEPDLGGFNKETTFYVTYDENGIEHSTIPLTQEEPKDWYEYGESRWANIVTRNNGLEIYYVWIPRYEFYLDQTNQRSIVKFIEGTSTETTQGYQIPEAFTYDGEQITGYWAMKYTVGEETIPILDTEVVATSSTIRTKGVTGAQVAEGQVYNYYINGEYKGQKTVNTDTFEFTQLESNKQYTILVEIRNSETDAYVGTILKQISTIDANKPVFGAKDETTGELEGFNPDNTYYVLYDENGNETIGEKIELDGSNMPQNWYNYSQSRWANIVVTDGTIENGQITGATHTTYYTWIPRYEFMITSGQQAQPASGRTEVRFVTIDITNANCTTGYQVPEAFTFDGKEIQGYWAMKYTVGD